MKERILLKNGKIITMDQQNTIVDSLAIKDGSVSALGSFSELSGLLENGVKVLDLKGMTVVPGFIDTHVHLLLTGLRSQQLELKGTGSFDDILDKIKLWDKDNPGDEWICGWGVDDMSLREKRMPEAKDLDRAGVKRPVWLLRSDGNSSTVNSYGLRSIVFSPDDFSVIKDVTGSPTGLFKVPSNFAIRLQIFDTLNPEIKTKSIEWASQFALRRGVTTAYSMEYLTDIALMREAFNRLPIRAELYARSDNFDEILNLNLKTFGGDVLFDGTFGCYTAAISWPYSDNPQESGVLYYENKKNTLLGLMKKAHAAGLQISFHAMGDRAIGMYLDLLEEIFKENEESSVNARIEHYELPTADQIEKTAKLGVMVSMSPASLYFYCLEGGDYFKLIGAERVKRALPFREILDHGIIIGGNSDSPVYEMNPLFGVYAAVNAPYEVQRMKLREALQIWTINGAKLGHKEDKRGSIEVGKFGDLVVLKENPFEVSQDKIKDIEVVMTFVGGEIKYQKDSSIKFTS